MGIKICGHKVRWQKPIKIYTFIKALCLVMVIGAFVAQPASAADTLSSKASTGAATAASSAQEKDKAPANKLEPQHRTQRTAGSYSVSPALALAMAFGVNVQGPVERRDGAHAPIPAKVTDKKTSSNAAALRLALGN